LLGHGSEIKIGDWETKCPCGGSVGEKALKIQKIHPRVLDKRKDFKLPQSFINLAGEKRVIRIAKNIWEKKEKMRI